MSSPGLVGAAEDHVLHPARREAAAVAKRADGGGGEIVGSDVGQDTTRAADRGADGGGNVGFGHGHQLGGEEDESLGGGVFRRRKVALTGFRRPAKLPPRNGTGGRAVEGARLESV